MIHPILNFYRTFNLSDSLTQTAAVLTVLLIIAILSVVVNYILKHYIVRLVHAMLGRSKSPFVKVLLDHKVFHRLSHIGPGLVIYFGIGFISLDESTVASKLMDTIKSVAATTPVHSPITAEMISAIKTMSMVYIIITCMMFISAFMNVIQDYYKTLPFSYRHPIRGYMQVARITFWALTIIIAISIVFDKSPWAFLTGLGAVSAVLLLVFKDTILGFVTSIQVSAYDMVRVGDWIQIDRLGVNGDVTDLAINTVKVKNFDNTRVTIPTYALMTDGVINWRAMTESGGRRIKRSISINIDSISFCDDALIAKLKELTMLHDHITSKLNDIQQYNNGLECAPDIVGNGRALTNIGLYRAYIESYLRHHNKIHKGMTLMVRQLQPTEAGLPIQIYAFTNDVKWANYEGIQADIFDHILAILPVFELKIFQAVTGDLAQTGSGVS